MSGKDRCQAVTPFGRQCKQYTKDPSGYCFQHKEEEEVVPDEILPPHRCMYGASDKKRCDTVYSKHNRKGERLEHGFYCLDHINRQQTDCEVFHGQGTRMDDLLVRAMSDDPWKDRREQFLADEDMIVCPAEGACCARCCDECGSWLGDGDAECDFCSGAQDAPYFDWPEEVMEYLKYADCVCGTIWDRQDWSLMHEEFQADKSGKYVKKEIPMF